MIIKDLFTERDGESFCPVRAAFIVGFAAILIFTIYDLATVDKADFLKSCKDWMSGLAQYLGFGGSAVAGKNFSEKEKFIDKDKIV